MTKAPAFQFYVKDWLSDAALQSASASSRGIWMNCLCLMWQAEMKGEIKILDNRSLIARLFNCTVTQAGQFLDDVLTWKFCDFERNNDGIITLRNRRMYREEINKEINRLKQQRFRDRRKRNRKKQKNNQKITSYSPSPSPSPNKKIYVEQARRIFEYWKEKTGKLKSQYSQERKMKIIARLKDGYTEEEAFAAIDGCLASEYHVSGGYTDITLIFRNAEKFERFKDGIRPKQEDKDGKAVRDFEKDQETIRAEKEARERGEKRRRGPST